MKTSNTVKNIFDHVELKNSNKEYSRVTRNALINKAREMSKPSLIPVMLKKQAY